MASPVVRVWREIDGERSYEFVGPLSEFMLNKNETGTNYMLIRRLVSDGLMATYTDASGKEFVIVNAGRSGED